MSETQVISATTREARGKGRARAVRRDGKVPAIIYGGEKPGQDAISIDGNELWKIINRGRFLSTVFEIDVAGQKTKAIPRDVQLDPVRDRPLHVDFQRIGSDGLVRILVPTQFSNQALSPGLKRGGVLNIVRREVEVWAPADQVPSVFEIDLDGLEIGTSIHISHVQLPEGVKPVIQDRDFTIATIAGSASARSESDAADADAEGAPAGAAEEAAPEPEAPKEDE